MKHVTHLVLVLLILCAVAVIGTLAGAALIPESFGSHDGRRYRGESLAEQKALPQTYADAASCLRPECHGENAPQEKRRVELSGGHEALGCQGCHGPAEDHVASEGKEGAPTAPKESALCLGCHLTAVGRPGKFPQIDDAAGHIEDMGGNEGDTCIECHDPHTCEAQ